MNSAHLTIVVIEDDNGHAVLIEKSLRRAGIGNTIRRFCDGTSALEYLFGTPPEAAGLAGRLLVLLDLNLPDVSGADILARIKRDRSFRHVPVVVLTTTDDAAEKRRCYELGANVYVTKPVGFDDFAAAILKLGLFLAIAQMPD